VDELVRFWHEVILRTESLPHGSIVRLLP